MAGVGVAVPEHAELGRLLGDRLVDTLRHHGRGEWHVTAGQRLGAGDDVGLHVVGLAAPHPAGAAEAADHLVGDQQDVVVLQDRLDQVEVPGRRRDDAARPHYRLGNEGRDVFRAFLLDQRLQLPSEARGEGLLALADLGEAIVVRAVGTHDIGTGQVEAVVKVRQPGQRGCSDADPVIRLGTRDDLLLRRPAEGVVVVAHHLDRGVVRVGAAGAEEDARHLSRRQREQIGRGADGDVGRLVRESVVVRQRVELARRRRDQALVRESERRAPEPGHALEVLAALVIVDVDAAAARHDDRALILVLAQVRERVDRLQLVQLSQARGLVHRAPPSVALRGRAPQPRIRASPRPMPRPVAPAAVRSTASAA